MRGSGRGPLLVVIHSLLRKNSFTNLPVMISIQISTSCRASLQPICKDLFDESVLPADCRERLYTHIKRYNPTPLLHEQIEQVVEDFMSAWNLS